MKKGLICLVLAGCLLCSSVPALAAAEDVPEREKAAVLRELDIMVGSGKGELRLGDPVTRAEFTKMLVTASVWKDSVGKSAATNPYPDVSYTKWYAPYVRAAVDAGLVKGDLTGYFRPESRIDLGEGVTMLVRLLGYSDSDFSGYRWPEGQMALAEAIHLTAGLDKMGADDPLSRGDCLQLFYTLLTVNSKSGAPYLQTLGHTLNAEGEVDLNALFHVEREGPIPLTGDYQALLPFSLQDALIFRDEKRAQASELREWDLLYWAKDQPILFAQSGGGMGQLSAAVEGPVVAEGNWAEALPFAPQDATSVTRNGVRAGWQDIREGDVVYYSKYGKSLTVYRRTVTGTVEAVSPSLAAPSAVVIAGQSYPLETLAAQYAFSDLGSFRKGDRVTLLLGRGGGAAAVRAAQEGSLLQVGMVSAITPRVYTDQDGAAYTAGSLTLLATDGQSYTYPWEDDGLEVGDLVQVTLDNGLAVVAALPERAITGQVDAGAERLGRLALSPDVEILDVWGDQAGLALPPSRIAGINFTGDMVKSYLTDADGTITHLILNDVSGDLHQYGVLTGVETVGFGLNFQSVYTLALAGRQQVLAVQGKQFPAEKGPVRLRLDGQTVDDLRSLRKLDHVTLSGQTAAAGGQSLTLSDRVSYYIYRADDNSYSSATRAQVTGGGYILSAWYDAADAQGGRVRVILAREK